MYQHSKQKIAVLNALPGFVESGISRENREIIYQKLIEIVITFDDTGILRKDSELKTGNDVLIKTIESLLKKE
jgi:hypothetical protein